MPKLDVCVRMYVCGSVCVSTHTHIHTHTHTKSKPNLVFCTNLNSINDLNAHKSQAKLHL